MIEPTRTKTVWKYPLTPGITDVPRNIVHVGVDPTEDDGPTLWCEIDPDETNRAMTKVTAFGTGHDIPSGLKFVGSVVTPAGLVWHVYRQFEMSDVMGGFFW